MDQFYSSLDDIGAPGVASEPAAPAPAPAASPKSYASLDDIGADEAPGFISNVVRGAGERAVQLGANFGGAVATAAEAGGDWMDENVGKPVMTEDGLGWERQTPEQTKGDSSWITKKLHQWQKDAKDVDFGDYENTSWKEVKDAPLANIVPFAMEQGFKSAPDMIAAVWGLPAYVMEQSFEIGAERAKNDGREEPTVADMVAGLPAAAISAQLEKIGTSKVLGLGEVALTELKQLPAELLKTLAVEGGTEAAQQAAQYGGGHAFTEKGVDWWAAAEETVQAALVGSIFGPAIRAPIAGAEIAMAPGASATPEQPGTTGNVAGPGAPPPDPVAPPTNGTSTPGAVGAATPAPPVSPPETGQPQQAVVPGVATPPLAMPGTVPAEKKTRGKKGAAPTVATPAGADEAAALGGGPVPVAAGHGLAETQEDPIEYEDPEGAEIAAMIQAAKPAVDPTLQAGLNNALAPAAPVPQQAAPVAEAPPIAGVPDAAPVPGGAPVAEAPTPPVVPVQPPSTEVPPAAEVPLKRPRGRPRKVVPPSLSIAEAPILPAAPPPVVEAPVTLAPVAAPSPSGIVEEEKVYSSLDEIGAPTQAPVGAPPVAEAPSGQLIKKNAPAASPVAPVDDFDPVKAAGLEADAPSSRFSKQLDDAVRAAIDKARDPLFDSPETMGHIDIVARNATRALPKGTPLAKLLANEVPKAVAQVRKLLTARKVREFERGEQQHEVAAKTAEQRKAEEKKPTRRGKYTKKSAEDLEQEEPRATHEAAAAEVRKPADKQDKRLAKIHEHVEARKTATGKAKVEHTKAIAALQRERVEERRAEEQAEAAEREKARKEIAGYSEARKKQVLEALERGDEAPHVEERPEDAEQKELAKAKERQETKERGEAISKVLADNPLSPKITDRPDWQKSISTYIKHLLSKSPEVGENVSQKRSAAEALLTYAKGFTDGSKKLDDITDFLLAMNAYQSGNKAEFWSLIANKRPEGLQLHQYGDLPTAVDEDTHEIVEPEDRAGFDSADFKEVPAGWDAVEGEPVQRMSQEGGLSEFNVGKTRVKPIARRKGGALLHSLMASSRLGGLNGIMRRMQAKRLRRLVGDTDTFFISGEDVASIAREYTGEAGADAAGAYVIIDGRPTILINEEVWSRSGNERNLHTHMHEMTHAATVRAIDLNENGIKDTLDAMVANLRANPSMTNEFGIWYGLSNAKELVAEAFTNPRFQAALRKVQVPDDIRRKIDRLVGGQPVDSWWDYIVQAIANGLGLLTGSRTNNYLEYTISLGQWGMQSSEAQEVSRIVERNVGMPRSPTDYNALIARQEALGDRLDNVVNVSGRAKGATARTRAIGNAITSSRALGRKFSDIVGTEDNPFMPWLRTFLNGQGVRTKIAQAGDRLGIKMKNARDRSKGSRAAFNEMQDIAHEATLIRADPTERNDNKHLGKSGSTHRAARRKLARLRARYNALPKEMKDLFKEVADHHKKQSDERIRLTVSNIVTSAVEGGKVLPPGETVDSVTKWVMDGGIDEVIDPNNPQPNDQRNTELHTALGSTARFLTDTKSMRKIKGIYVPLIRYGQHYYSMTHKVDVPQGAELEGDNTLVFDDEKDLNAYLDSTDEDVSPTKHRWVDPTDKTKIVTKMDMRADPNDPTSLLIPVKRFVVTVNNKTMRMSDSLSDLHYKQKQDAKNPNYTVSDVAKLDTAMNGADHMLSKAARSLIGAVEQQMVGNATVGQQAIINGIRDAEIRRMSGSRAAHRRLKRKNVKGFEEDLIKTTITSSRTMAGHLHNLRQAPVLARQEKELQDWIKGRKYDGTGQTLQLQQIYDEVKHRQNALATRNEDTFGSKASRLMRNIGYGAYLVSQSYLVNNMLQPLMTTLPKLGGTHGYARATREMYRAIADMGGGSLALGLGKTAFRGGAESLKTGYKDVLSPIVAKALRRPSPTRYIEDQTWTDWSIEQYRKSGAKDIADIERVLKAAELEGLDSSGGTEAHTVGAMLNTGFMDSANSFVDRSTSFFRRMSEAVETINRNTTLVAAMRLAKDDKLADPVEHALNMTEATQGGYQDANNPAFLSHGGWAIVFSFKRFTVMYANLFYKAFAQAIPFRKLDPKTKRQARRTLAGLAISTIALAGASGLPPWEIATALFMVAQMLGATDDDWEDKEKGIQKWLADHLKGIMGVKSANQLAEYTWRGFSRMEPIGVDLSNRLGNSSMVLFNTPRGFDKENLFQFFGDLVLGAPGQIPVDILDKYHKGELMEAATAAAPKFVKDLLAANKKADEGVKNKFGRQLEKPYGAADWWKTMLGYKPAESARTWETGSGAKNKAKKETSIARSKLMQAYTQAQADGKDREQEKALQEIERWNEKHPDERINRGNLIRSRNRERQLRSEEGR